jgi:uncharacterized protein (DUF983 family)
MASMMLRDQTERFAHDPAARGYSVAYRPGQANFCPGCGRSHWFVGRVSAECGFCATALPLIEATAQGIGTQARIVHRAMSAA